MNYKLLFCILLSVSSTEDYAEPDYCIGVDYQDLEMDSFYLEQQRKSSKIHIDGKYNKLLEYYIDGNQNALTSTVSAFTAFLIIFLILTFACFILFTINLFNKFKRESNSFWSKKYRVAFRLSLILFVTFFIVFCAYAGKANRDYDRARCALLRVGKGLVTGETMGYMGSKKH